ncbi:MAG: TIGR03016 family PEP-CTERM system-associated outer membrane protein [Colwellia sp.]|nr:TIGR03016 family PEP-CTERM system-associated outer membrane protein [Colwellia sp.]
MAIMAMDMAKNINKKRLNKLSCFIFLNLASSIAVAGEWTFEPNLGLTETYSNNVELTPVDHQSSVVSQLIAGFDAKFKSREVDFSFSGTETFAAYSHDSDLNDDYQTASVDGLISLWRDGPKFIATSHLTNVSQNNANNSLADLVSGDTVQQRFHSAGIQYQTANSSHNFNGSVIYSLTETEDSIGESKGYTAIMNSENGNAARHVFWSLSGQYTDRKNNNTTGTNYSIEAQVGAITSIKLNPFIRFYDEDVTGIGLNNSKTSTLSWGPGVRWQASEHFYIDLSYNYVDDKTASDDYVATNINWQPSQRTSLIAGYNQRFFGDSYNLDFSHRTKRLANTISYHETLEIYDRDSFEEVGLGEFWCPVGGPFNANSCFPSSQPPNDTAGFILVPLSGLEPVENNEFSLNKRLAWNSILTLSRTTFTFDISTRERENLSTGILDDNFDISLSATRTLSPRSNLKFLTSYREATFDKNFSPTAPRQEDTYKTFSTTYNRNLASSLSAYFTLQYLERESSRITLTYDEVRAYINITKDF